MRDVRETVAAGGREGRPSSGRPGRVAYLVTSSGMGGAERQVCHLAQAFHRRGWEVAVISMLPLESPVADLASDGIITTSLGMRRGTPDPRAVVRLRAFIRSWRPDVVHAHMVHANLLARLTRLVAKGPVVISTIHNQDEGSQWRYVAYRMTDRLSRYTTTVSEVAMAEAVRRRGVRASTALIVPNGVRTDDYVRDPSMRERVRASLGLEGRFIWLAAGRLVEAKGYDDMIDAFKAARERHPEAVLLIAGFGPLEESIRERARKAGVGPDVRLLGLREDVPELMQAADAFVMSSKWEGLPMVLLEAGASALPIAATDVGGSRDAVLDGVSGYVTPAGDPVSLARAMSDIMDLDAGDRESMGASGRAHVCRTFEIDVIADRWETLYGAAFPRRPSEE